MKDNIYEKFTTCLAQIGPKIRSTQNLLKFGKFSISNRPILILMSKMVFMKYLLLGLNWYQNKKMLKIYWNLVHSIFQICKSGLWVQKWFLWIIYQLSSQINSKIKIALKCMFDISSIPILTTRSDNSFSEQLLHVMPKLVSKFKFLYRLWNVK